MIQMAEREANLFFVKTFRELYPEMWEVLSNEGTDSPEDIIFKLANISSRSNIYTRVLDEATKRAELRGYYF